MSRFNSLKPFIIEPQQRWRVTLAIVIAVISFLLLYLWQQYLFILFRYVNTNFGDSSFNIDYVISQDSIRKLSLFFAGNAAIIGNSIGISFLSHFYTKNKKYKRRLAQIRNNQSFVVGSYYFWAFKITFVIFMINIFNLVDFGITSALFQVVPFLFLALFLESVKGLRRFWRWYTLKKLFIHGLIIAGSIWGISHVNHSAYDAIELKQEEGNPFVELPLVHNENGELYDHSYFLYRVRDNVKVIQRDDTLEYRFYRQKYSIEELMCKILESGHHGKYRQAVTLYMPGDMAYYKLQELESALVYHNLSRVYYMQLDIYRGIQIPFRKNLYLKEEMFLNIKEKTTISIEQFVLDGSINKNQVEDYFYTTVDSKTVFQFEISKTVTLQHYIDFINGYRASVNLRRRAHPKRLNTGIKEPSSEFPFKYVEVFVD